MDTLICNKCFAPMYRGKQPYNITQCGHIYCEDCLQQAEKQCTQCGYNGALSMVLKEPLKDPNVRQLFMPLVETLEMLFKVDEFRSNQMKIIMQRFLELDKKYDMLKNQYWIARRNMKILNDKYVSLKHERGKFDNKKLLFSDVQREIPRRVATSSPSNDVTTIKTPKKSNIFIHSTSSGYSSGSMELRSVQPTPEHSTDAKRQYKTADGFRISTYLPTNTRKNMTSVNSRDMNTSSNSCFMR
ncbi:RING finger protein 212B-like [Harpegnathos saltator]|uniref:RING finger protein 212B n=1 Tax=Harpegnathos saltator TaxID=610380 RepID=UPI00058CF359|nr:RING finger protein 212B [Harpegnathos saltator]XP_025159776.1 RING finger protein 212B-like [Harpegnathos saltator]